MSYKIEWFDGKKLRVKCECGKVIELVYNPKLQQELAKKEVSNKIKKGITKMEKQGHVLPRRNIHFMIDLIMEKELKLKQHKN